MTKTKPPAYVALVATALARGKRPCSGCGHPVRVRPDGTAQLHGVAGVRCEGTGKPVAR